MNYLDEIGLTSVVKIKPPKRERRKKHPEEILHESIAGLLRHIIGFAGETTNGVFWISHENKPRSKIVAISNQRRGVKAGFPDIEIIYDGCSYFGEIKVPKKGRMEESQKAMHPHLRCAGAPVDIWLTPQDVMASLVKWGIPHLVSRIV